MSTTTIDRIFVTWTQQWDVDHYIDHYLRTRRLAASEATRACVRECMASYTGGRPHTKSDLDFFLDANIGRHR